MPAEAGSMKEHQVGSTVTLADVPAQEFRRDIRRSDPDMLSGAVLNQVLIGERNLRTRSGRESLPPARLPTPRPEVPKTGGRAVKTFAEEIRPLTDADPQVA